MSKTAKRQHKKNNTTQKNKRIKKNIEIDRIIA